MPDLPKEWLQNLFGLNSPTHLASGHREKRLSSDEVEKESVSSPLEANRRKVSRKPEKLTRALGI